MTREQRLIVVSGLPGVGKSSLARRLAAELAVPHISVDPVEVAMWRAGVGRDQPTGLAAYVVVETIVSEQLEVGLDVIVDAVNAAVAAQQGWIKLAEKFDAQLYLIECVVADSNEHRRRLAQRQRPHGYPEPSWAEVEARSAEFSDWGRERLVLDMGQTLARAVTQAVAYIADR